MDLFWTWSIWFFGCHRGDWLFTHRGKCAGYFAGDIIYSIQGHYLGEVARRDILRVRCSRKHLRSVSRGAQIGGAIASCANRAGYVLCAGHEDSPATDEF